MVSFLFAAAARAETPAPNWTDTNMKGYGDTILQNNQTKNPTKEGIDTNSVNNIMNALIRSTTCANCNPKDIEAKKASAFSNLAQATGFLYAMPPASGGHYVATLLDQAGFASPAYAAGVGAKGLDPVMSLWKAFRNVAYLGFVLYFVIIGFMIMFRAKLDPKTTVTIQNSLPRVIVTLLLVTFSYAIAGLMIDLMYVAIFLVIGVFDSTGLITNLAEFKKTAFNYNIFQLIWGGGAYFWSNPAGAIGEIVGNFFFFSGGVSIPVISGVLDLVGGGLKFLLSAVLTLIFSITCLIVMLILFFTLLKTYISILASIILSPLVLSLNAIPGNDTVGKWFKNLIAELSAFPVVIGMILLAAVLSGAGSSANINRITGQPVTQNILGSNPWGIVDNGMDQPDAFVPPLIGMQAKGNAAAPLGALIGFTIFLMTPSAVNMMKELLKSEGMKSAKGVGMMAGVSGATGPIMGGLDLMYKLHLASSVLPKGLRDRLGIGKTTS